VAPLVESYRDRTVLLLGASGFIGRAVAHALTRAGARLLVASRRARSSGTAETVQPMALDMTDAPALGELLRRLEPDVTFNLAGYGVNPAERDDATAHAVNAESVRALAECVADLPASTWPWQRLVHVGSALEYGQATGDLREDTEARPTTLYGRTKLEGTRAVRDVAGARALRAVTARLFMVYGPGERAGRLLPTLRAAARDGTTVRLTSGTQRRDFTYVEDAAEGLLRVGASDAEPGAVINVATGQLTTIRDFVLRAARVLHLPDGQLAFGALPPRPEEMRHDPVNISRLRELTGWSPTTSIEEGVRRTLTM
jgi:nucleoside-diphosphate-sugar epimerase